MSKRTSREFNDEKKSAKRIRKNLDIEADTTESLLQISYLNESSNEGINSLNSRVIKIFKDSSNSQKINELTEFFKEIIQADNSTNNLNTLFMIMIEYLSTNSTKLDDKLVSQITSLLSFQIESLDLHILKRSLRLFVSQINKQMPFNQKCVDIFLEIFRLVKTKPEIENDYINTEIKNLMESKWTELTALNILSLAKILSLDNNQIKQMLSKLFDLEEIKWPTTQVANLISSVLSLSTKSNRSIILEHILQFFTNISNNMASNESHSQIQMIDHSESELLSILHIIHLVKTDQNIGKDLIKVLKLKLNGNLKDLIQPFHFCLILALIKVVPQKELVIDGLLKQVVMGVFEAELKWKKHYWIAKCLTENEKALSSSLLKLSKCRLFGTDAILPGLILFLFDLLDTNGVRMIKTSKATNMPLHLTIYASEMIRAIFRNIQISREEILKQLTERIFSLPAKSPIFIDQLTILIQSEPAISFQNYFAKFKTRLDHLIHMSPVISLEFLNSIKPLLKYDTDYKNNLITILKKSIYQSDLHIRKVGLNGLLCLLNTTKLSSFLPSSQASQSMSLSQSLSQMIRINMSQEKNAEGTCLEIFQSLRRCLTQQTEIRSKLYQSCCCLIAQNNCLVGPILNLLLINLENYVIKCNLDFVFDLSKCVRTNEKDQVELVEPIDILLHSIHLCQYKYIKLDLNTKFQDQMDEDIKKHSDMIRVYFDRLKEFLMQQSAEHLIETYKAQISSKLLTISKPAKANLLKPIPSNTQSTQMARQTQKINLLNNPADNDTTSMSLYQCLIGSYEVLMEHYFMNGSFKTMRDLYKKFQKLDEFALKKFSGMNEEAAAKKKPPSKKASNKNTKQKKGENKNPNETNINEDENEEIKASSNDTRPTLLDLTANTSSTETPLLESTKNVNSRKGGQVKKKEQAKFSYTHRLSYSCLNKLLKILFSNDLSKIKIENSDNDMGSCDETLEEFYTQINLDETFASYLMKVLNQQLDFILNEHDDKKIDAMVVYDCESYNQKELFNYLSDLWILFWHRMSLLKCPNQDCDTLTSNFYCGDCVKNKTSYITILAKLWKIFFIKFSPKLNELFSLSINSSITQNESSQPQSQVPHGIFDMCRQFVERCLNHQDAAKAISFKLAALIIDLMYEIGTNVTLKPEDYGVLFAWSQSMLSNDINNDIMVLKSFIKFFIYITWNKNSSSTLIKYICKDMAIILSGSSSNDTTSNSEQTFSALNFDNVMSLISIMSDEIISTLNAFEWFISFKTDSNSICYMHKQICFVNESLKSMLDVIDSLSQYHDTMIKLFAKYYSLLILLCKSVLQRKDKINADEEKMLKCIVDFTAKKLQTPLNNFIRKIQSANASFTKKNKEAKKTKQNANEGLTSARILRLAKMIPNLVYLIEQYEQQLKILNKHYENKIDFTENFEVCLRDFKIVLPDQGDDTQQGDSDENSVVGSDTNETENTNRNETDGDSDDS